MRPTTGGLKSCDNFFINQDKLLDEENLIEYNGYDVLTYIKFKGGVENETDNGCYL